MLANGLWINLLPSLGHLAFSRGRDELGLRCPLPKGRTSSSNARRDFIADILGDGE